MEIDTTNGKKFEDLKSWLVYKLVKMILSSWKVLL